jgi:hypothetical protein
LQLIGRGRVKATISSDYNTAFVAAAPAAADNVSDADGW